MEKENKNLFELQKLKGVMQLLKESWQIYRNKIKTLLGIMAVLVGFNVLSELLINFLSASDIKYNVIFSIILALTSIIYLFIWFLTIPTLLFAIKDNIGIKESYGKSFKVLITFIWIYFLNIALVIGSSILYAVLYAAVISSIIIILQILANNAIFPDYEAFFRLASVFIIIFSILFSVRFGFAFFALIFENEKGMNAILKSKFLINKNFWKVLKRFLLLGLLIFIPLYILFQGSRLWFFGYVMNLLELLIMPFILIYGLLIYENIKEVKKEIPYKEPSLGKKLKYLLSGTLGTIIITFMIVIFSLNIIWGRDEMPPDDSDLRLPKIKIANEEENAFYWLAPWMGGDKDEFVSKYWAEGRERLKEKKEVYLPKDKIEIVNDMIAGKTWDEKFAEELLEKNQELFADFDKAASSPYFQDPVLRNPENINQTTVLLSYSEFRNISKLNLLKASYLFNHGKEEEAFDEAFKVIKFGYLIKNSQGTLIGYLLATSMEGTGLNKVRIMIPKTNLSPDDLKSYIYQLEELRDNGQGLVKIMKMKYAHLSNGKKLLIDIIYEGKLSQEQLKSLEESGKGYYLEASKAMRRNINYLYKPNQTQRFLIEDFRILVANAGKEYCNELSELDSRNFDSLQSMGPLLIFTENPIGKILHEIVQTSFIGSNQRKCEENFSIAGAQTLIALKLYKSENGDLPASLEELVPAYLSETPRDFFNGKPIKYSKEKKIIYSVGKDLKDSDGSYIMDNKKGIYKDDIIYKIEF